MSEDLSGFRTIVEAVRLKLIEIQAENAAIGIVGSPAIAPEGWCVGRLAVKEHKVQPYVGWVRGGGELGAHDQKYIAEGTLAVVPLYRADSSVLAVICGNTEAETEALWIDVLRAVNGVLNQAAGARDFEWPTQDEKRASYVYDGAELVLQQFVWPLIVPRDIKRTVVLQSQSHDDRFGKPPTMTTNEH